MADSNVALIEKFYTAFNKKDPTTMNSCYSNDIVFHDPVFGLLEGDKAKCMWEMLCKNAKEFSLTYSNIQDLGDGYFTCNWEAQYIFSKTGKKVVNKIKANIKIADNKIIEHSDAFSLHHWSAQAFGFSGWLLGGFSFFQKKIKNGALKNLLAYMKTKGY